MCNWIGRGELGLSIWIFRPLIVARVHQLGGKREILNGQLMGQYRDLLGIVSTQPVVSPTQKLEIVYYMILQNRIAEAIAWFDSIAKDEVSTNCSMTTSMHTCLCANANTIRPQILLVDTSSILSRVGKVSSRKSLSQVKQRQELLAQGQCDLAG